MIALFSLQVYSAYTVWQLGGFEQQSTPLLLWIASTGLIYLRFYVATVVQKVDLALVQLFGEALPS